MAKRRLRPGCTGVLAAILLVCVMAGVAAYVIFFKEGKSVWPGTSSKAASSGASSKASSGSASSAKASSGVTSAVTADLKAGGVAMLVNAKTPIPTDYSPTLTTVAHSYFLSEEKDNHFDSRAAPYLTQMLDAAKKAGVPMFIVSGYRSHTYQVTNFNNQVASERKAGKGASAASAAAATKVAIPGTSEHELGLAVDLVNEGYKTSKNELLANGFANTEAFAWLEENAADYGFVLRYPENKTDVTGIEYESWHWRYVGKDIAAQMKKSGLCLEEFYSKYK